MLENATGLKFSVVPHLVHLFGPLFQFWISILKAPNWPETLKMQKKNFIKYGALKIEIQKTGKGVQMNALGEVPHKIWAL